MADEIHYKPNSKVAKRSEAEAKPEKKVEKVVSGNVIRKKKSLGSKFTELFTGENAKSAAVYVFVEVIVPSTKQMIEEAFKEQLSRMLWGENRPRSSAGRNVAKAYVSYNNMYGGSSTYREDKRRAAIAPRTHSNTRAPDEIILESRSEAESVIERMVTLIQEYDVATVSDMLDLVGTTGSFTDDKWGWTDLRAARVRKVPEGYLLDLPRAIPLD